MGNEFTSDVVFNFGDKGTLSILRKGAMGAVSDLKKLEAITIALEDKTNKYTLAQKRAIAAMAEGMIKRSTVITKLKNETELTARLTAALNNLGTGTNKAKATADRLVTSLEKERRSLEGVTKAAQKANTTRNSASSSQDKATASAKKATQEHSRLLRILQSVAASYITYNLVARSIRTVTGTLEGVVKSGMQFNETMESARLGIAAMISASGDLVDSQGRSLKGAEKFRHAQALSVIEMEKLRIAGLATVATTEQLVEGYQQAVAPLSAAGVKLDDIANVTVKIVQAAGALGMPMYQINEEIRSIAAGTITQHSRVAKTLGITNAMVKEWKAMGTFVENINQKLEAFNLAGQEAFESWRGIKSNAQEAFEFISGMATSGLFDKLKGAAIDVLNSIFNIDFANGDWTKATFEISPQLQPLVDSMKESFDALGDSITKSLNVETIKNFFGAVQSGIGILGALIKVLDLLVNNAMLLAGYLVSMASAFKLVRLAVIGLIDSTRVLASTMAMTWVGLGIGLVMTAIGVYNELHKSIEELVDAAISAHIAFQREEKQFKKNAKAYDEFNKELDLFLTGRVTEEDLMQKIIALSPSLATAYRTQKKSLKEVSEELARNLKLQEAAYDIAQKAATSAGLSAVRGIGDAVKEQAKNLRAVFDDINKLMKSGNMTAVDSGMLIVKEVMANTRGELEKLVTKLHDLQVKYQDNEAVAKAISVVFDELSSVMNRASGGAVNLSTNMEKATSVLDEFDASAVRAQIGADDLADGLGRVSESAKDVSSELDVIIKRWKQAIAKDQMKDIGHLEALLAKSKDNADAQAALAYFIHDLKEKLRKKEEKAAEAAQKELDKRLKESANKYMKHLKAVGDLWKSYRDGVKALRRENMTDEERALEDYKAKYEKVLSDLNKLEANSADESIDYAALKFQALKEYEQGRLAITTEYAEKRAKKAEEEIDKNKSSVQKLLESWADTNEVIKTLNEQTWKSIQSSIKTAMDGIINGEDGWNSLPDAFRSVGDLLVSIATDIASQIMTALALRGLAWLFLDSSSGSNSNVIDGLVNKITGNSGGGVLGTASSALSAVSGISKIAGWLGIGGATTSAASTIGGALSVSAMSGAPAGTLAAWQAAEAANVAALGGADAIAGGASSSLWSSAVAGPIAPMAAVLGPIAVAAVGGMIMNAMAEQMTPEEAQKQLGKNLGWLDSVKDNVSAWNLDNIQDASHNLNLFAERAGLTEEQVDLLTLGMTGLQEKFGTLTQDAEADMDRLRQALQSALDAGDMDLADKVREELESVQFNYDQAVAAITGDMQELQAIGEATGIAIDGLGEAASVMVEMAQVAEMVEGTLAGLAEGYLATTDGMNNTTQASRDMLEGMSDLISKLGLGEEESSYLQTMLDKLGVEFLSGDMSAGELANTLRDAMIPMLEGVANEGSATAEAIRSIGEAIESLPTEYIISINTHYVDDAETNHSGGLIRHHNGALVQRVANDVSTLGSIAKAHSGEYITGLRPDEVHRILQVGEFVVQQSSVNAETYPVLRQINATGHMPSSGGGQTIEVSVQNNFNGDIIGEESLMSRIEEAGSKGAQAAMQEVARYGDRVTNVKYGRVRI